MKINYVLGDQDKTRTKQVATKQDKIVQVGDSKLDLRPAPRLVMTDAEDAMIRDIVEKSGYFERSKIRDLDPDLIREFIR